MDYHINVYEKVFIKDIKEKIEGSFVIISGVVVSLTVKEKALIIQSKQAFFLLFLSIEILVDDSTETIECILFLSSTYFPEIVHFNLFFFYLFMSFEDSGKTSQNNGGSRRENYQI